MTKSNILFPHIYRLLFKGIQLDSWSENIRFNLICSVFSEEPCFLLGPLPCTIAVRYVADCKPIGMHLSQWEVFRHLQATLLDWSLLIEGNLGHEFCHV